MEKALRMAGACMVISAVIIAVAVIYHARTGRFQFQPHNGHSVVRMIDTVTGKVTIQAACHRGVLRVPNAALRWKPTPELLAPATQPPALIDETPVHARGKLWAIAPDGRHVVPLAVRIGLTDDTMTEISGREVKEGMEVVDGRTSAATPPAAPTGNIPAVKEFGVARTGPIDTGYEVKGPS